MELHFCTSLYIETNGCSYWRPPCCVTRGTVGTHLLHCCGCCWQGRHRLHSLWQHQYVVDCLSPWWCSYSFATDGLVAASALSRLFHHSYSSSHSISILFNYANLQWGVFFFSVPFTAKPFLHNPFSCIFDKCSGSHFLMCIGSAYKNDRWCYHHATHPL